jgi:hypothetical protein
MFLPNEPPSGDSKIARAKNNGSEAAKRPTCPPKLKAKAGLTALKFGSNFLV